MKGLLEAIKGKIEESDAKGLNELVPEALKGILLKYLQSRGAKVDSLTFKGQGAEGNSYAFEYDAKGTLNGKDFTSVTVTTNSQGMNPLIYGPSGYTK